MKLPCLECGKYFPVEEISGFGVCYDCLNALIDEYGVTFEWRC